MEHHGTGSVVRGKRGRMRPLALVAVGMILALTVGAGTALADGQQHHSIAENTFTKWITEYPAMAGIVGGDVGEGTFAGEILQLTVTDTGLVIDAAYHFSGSRHSFTALVHVVQTGFVDGSAAAITGHVTTGWLRGNRVDGAYTQIPCAQGTCFQGTLDVLRGSRSDDS